MPKEFIVAIELGSSKMTGIAGQKNLDGSITVLAIVEENSSSCIRKGVIYNIDKTCQCLTSIIKKLKNLEARYCSSLCGRRRTINTKHQECDRKRLARQLHHISGNDQRNHGRKPQHDIP